MLAQTEKSLGFLNYDLVLIFGDELESLKLADKADERFWSDAHYRGELPAAEPQTDPDACMICFTKVLTQFQEAPGKTFPNSGIDQEIIPLKCFRLTFGKDRDDSPGEGRVIPDELKYRLPFQSKYLRVLEDLS